MSIYIYIFKMKYIYIYIYIVKNYFVFKYSASKAYCIQ